MFENDIWSVTTSTFLYSSNMFSVIFFLMAVALATPVPANLQFRASRVGSTNTFSTIVPTYTPAPAADKPRDVKIMFDQDSESEVTRRSYNSPQAPSQDAHYALL